MTSKLIPPEERPHYIRFVLGVGCVIIVYAMIHDLILVTGAPEHFTVYHRTLVPNSPRLQALACGLFATTGPGMFFGMMLYVVARMGAKPKWLLKQIIPYVIGLVVLVDVISFSIGGWVRQTWLTTRTVPIPTALFPEMRADLIWAQSVNLLAYVLMSVGALVVLGVVYCKRRHRADSID